MKINKVTITGADDLVDIQDLVDLQKQFPFVEFGILAHPNKFEELRYPSPSWIDVILKTDLCLAFHFCGGYVTNCILGHNNLNVPFDKRIQLNFPKSTTLDLINFEFLSEIKNQIIIQDSGIIPGLVNEVEKFGQKFSLLYDLSGGNGILPGKWIEPSKIVPFGFAGGLNPENLEEQLKKISDTTDQTIWIDTETGVRTDNRFDLKKAKQFLEIAQNWI